MSFRRGIVYTFLSQIPTLVLYFLASTLMTRLLGDTGRGEYALLVNLSALLNLFLGLNMALGVTYFTARSGTDADMVRRVAMTMLLVNMVLVAVVLWVMYAQPFLRTTVMPAQRLAPRYWAYVYLIVVSGLFNTSVSGLFLGLKRFKVLNFMSIFTAASSATGFLLLYLLHGEADDERLFDLVIAVTAIHTGLVTAIWCLLYVLYVGGVPRPVFSFSLLRPVLAFSLVGHASNVINLINYRFDTWVVDAYQGPAALGLYTVAVGLAQMMFHIPDNFVRVMQPFLFGAGPEGMIDRFKAVARLNFTVVLVMLLGLAGIAHWLVPVLFGKVFAASVTPLYLLLPGVLFTCASKIMALLVIQKGAQRFNLLGTLLGVVVTIGLDLVLIPAWGIRGAALASTASYLTIFLVVALTFKLRLGVSIHDTFLLRTSDLSVLKRR